MTLYKASPESIELASRAIREGDVICMPTETVYGLAGDALNPASIEKIYNIKNRPLNNPLIVHVPVFEDIFKYASVTADSPEQHRLLKLRHFWPGPLTVILKRSPVLPSMVSAGGDTVAIRIPRHPVALAILSACRRPLAAPSANPSGYISPTCAEHVERMLGEKIGIIIDGGPSEVGLESTVLSLIGEKPCILRPGLLDAAQLSSALGEEVQYLSDSQTPAGTMPSPGLLSQHYSPRTPAFFYDQLKDSDYTDKRVGYLCFDQSVPMFKGTAHLEVIRLSGDNQQNAREIYAALHKLDQMSLDLIVVDKIPAVGAALAIMDRLNRATAHSSHKS